MLEQRRRQLSYYSDRNHNTCTLITAYKSLAVSSCAPVFLYTSSCDPFKHNPKIVIGRVSEKEALKSYAAYNGSILNFGVHSLSRFVRAVKIFFLITRNKYSIPTFSQVICYSINATSCISICMDQTFRDNHSYIGIKANM